MPIPSPEPGLVISYAYLWHYEHQAGREEGQKDCPSVIVLAIEPISRNTSTPSTTHTCGVSSTSESRTVSSGE